MQRSYTSFSLRKKQLSNKDCFKALYLADIGVSLILSSSPALPTSLSSPGTMPEQGLLPKEKVVDAMGESKE